MAYNISVATHTADERWGWVNKGISLLRDKGIAYNPKAVPLYRELGWLYFHKIGQSLDDMHWYYKVRLALEWQEALGAPTEGATMREAIEAFRVIPESPDDWDELEARHPGVKGLLSRFQDLGYELDETLLRQMGRVEMYRASVDAWLLEGVEGRGHGHYDARVAEVMDRGDGKEALGPLLGYLRKRVLREHYRMDAGLMLELMEEYGPIDWRHPAAHGCYWSEMGVRVAGEMKVQDKQIDLLNTNRQSIHSLQQLAWFGRMSFDPVSQSMDLLPDPRFIPAYDRAMDRAKENIESGVYGEDISLDTFKTGHENFLLRAMTDYYLYGDREEALRLYKKAERLYGDRLSGRASGRYGKTIDDAVIGLLRENLEAMADTRQFITAMVVRGIDEGLANGRKDVFDRYVRVAREVYVRYQRDKGTAPDGEQERRSLPPFREVLAANYIVVMKSPTVSLLKRARVWSNSPLRLKQRVYSRLRMDLFAQATRAGLDPEKVFPAPESVGAAQGAEGSGPVEKGEGGAGDGVTSSIERR
jgi:hypothetical protein